MNRGFALPAVLIGLVIAITSMALWASRSTGNLDRRARIKTEMALRTAREAMIQHAAWEDSSPGALLCPDLDNDGISDVCSAATPLGRFPWKTVGIEAPLDGAGECLWYAISPGARSMLKADSRGAGGTQPALNPSWMGELSLSEEGGTAHPVVAVLIAPGRALAGQLQIDNGKPCRDGTAANFLESSGGSLLAFVSANEHPGFNDRLLAIDSERLFSAAAPRVLIDLGGPGAQPGSGLRKLFMEGHPSAELGPDANRHPIIDFTTPMAQMAFPAPTMVLPTIKNGCTFYNTAGNFTIEWICFNAWISHILYQPQGPTNARLQIAGWQLDIDPLHAPVLHRPASP